MPSPTYIEIPTTLRERDFVLARRVASGDHHPSDLASLNLTGPFRVNAEEAADVLQLRKHQDGRFGEVGGEDEVKVFERVRRRLLNGMRDRKGREMGVKREEEEEEVDLKGKGPAKKVKREVVVANGGFDFPPSPRATVTPKPSHRAGPSCLNGNESAGVIDLCSLDDEEETPQQMVMQGLALAGLKIAPLAPKEEKSRPFDDPHEEGLGEKVQPHPSHQASKKRVKIELTGPGSLNVDGEGGSMEEGANTSSASTSKLARSMSKDAILARGFDELDNVKWMNEPEKLKEARRLEKLDDDTGNTHRWRAQINLLPASFLATVDPANDWTTLIDLEYNTLFKITKEEPYDANLFARLSAVIQFRAYPWHRTDYEDSALFKAWEDDGAGGDVLLLAAWLRVQILSTILRHRKKDKKKRVAKRVSNEIERDEPHTTAFYKRDAQMDLDE